MKNGIILLCFLFVSQVGFSQTYFKVYDDSLKKYGLYNEKGKIVISIDYDSIQRLQNDFIVYKDNKIGVIDKNGVEILPTVYSRLLTSKCNRQTFLPVLFQSKWMIFNRTGKLITKRKFDKVGLPLTDTIFAVERKRYLVLDTLGKVLTRIPYDPNKRRMVINEECYEILVESFPTTLEEKRENFRMPNRDKSVTATKENYLYGYKKNDEWIIEPIYYSLKKTTDGYWMASKTWTAILDENGVPLTEFIYDSYQTCGAYVILVKFIPGEYSVKYVPKIFGVFSVKEKKFIVPMAFSNIEPIRL